jgi:hypothetical protein
MTAFILTLCAAGEHLGAMITTDRTPAAQRGLGASWEERRRCIGHPAESARPAAGPAVGDDHG